ncbi:MAG: hypothetical protein QXF82_10820 [Nitrososphaeria archaeon]
MTKEEIERMQCTLSAMNSALNNIESWNKYKEVKEIMVIIPSEEVSKVLKEVRYNGKDCVQPSYISGDSKDNVIDLLIQYQQEFYDKMSEKLMSENTKDFDIADQHGTY